MNMCRERERSSFPLTNVIAFTPDRHRPNNEGVKKQCEEANQTEEHLVLAGPNIVSTLVSLTLATDRAGTTVLVASARAYAEAGTNGSP
jgi:hypothetical protein